MTHRGSGITTAVALCLAAAAYANSPLAAGTPGEPGVSGDARAMGMGGTAVGAFDGLNANVANPAVAASLTSAVFNLDVYRAYNSYKTAYGEGAVVAYDVPAVKLTLPVTAASAMSLSFRQLFNQNFDLARPLEDEGEVIGTSRLLGRGGIYQGRLGAAAKLGDRWYVGVAGAYDFGAPKEIYRKEFTAKGYSNIEETLEASYRGFGGVVGAGFVPIEKLSLGAVAEYYLPHRGYKTVFTEYGTLAEDDFTFTPPWTAAAGAAYAFGPRGRVALDVRYRAWSSFAFGDLYSAGEWALTETGASDYGFRDTVSFHAGAEGRVTTSRKAFLPLRVPYRVGVFYEPWYDRSRGAAARMGAAVGAGYLFKNNDDSRLDITFEYARRGSLGATGAEEQMYNLYLSVVGLESWLSKPGEEED